MGLEPTTYGLKARCSTSSSYRRANLLSIETYKPSDACHRHGGIRGATHPG